MGTEDFHLPINLKELSRFCMIVSVYFRILFDMLAHVDFSHTGRVSSARHYICMQCFFLVVQFSRSVGKLSVVLKDIQFSLDDVHHPCRSHAVRSLSLACRRFCDLYILPHRLAFVKCFFRVFFVPRLPLLPLA